jgi:FkbM family methyltransferase
MISTCIQRAGRAASSALGRNSWLVRTLRPAYEGLLDLVSLGGGIPWTINGVTYRIDPHFRHMLASDYDEDVARYLSSHVKPGDVCWDVGANVGVYAMQFAYWSGPNGKVVAFEPNPYARKVLLKHVELNCLQKRVEVEPIAIGERRGSAELYAAGADGMSRLGEPNILIAARTTAIEVTVESLDEVATRRKQDPDWLLMDIEGFEIAALRGGKSLLKRCRNTLKVIVEMHPAAWASAGTGRADAEELLQELGLEAIPMQKQADPLEEYGLALLRTLS